MARRLARLTTLVLCLPPALASALGIGSVETRSALNEPLEARMPLYPDGANDLETMTIRLAEPDAFQRAGLDRPFILSQLDFEVVDTGGEPYVAITTEDPVREPFLAFVVEVRWSGGRLLREYTLLLDPPVYQPREAPPTRMADAEPSPQTAPARPARQSVDEAPESAPSGSGSTASEYGPVRRNQTLWDIAVETRADDSVSVHQMMMALLRANPDAFVDGNVNNLRAGAILRVPERSEVESLTVAEARREFARQTEAWQAGRTPQPQSAPEPEPESEPESEVAEADEADDSPAGQEETDGRLQVVAAGEGDGDDPTATVEADELANAEQDVQRLENELTALQESEASLRSEADELRQMNADLLERVEALERMVNLQTGSPLPAETGDEALQDIPLRDEGEQVADLDAPLDDEPLADDESPVPGDESPEVSAVEPPASESGSGSDATEEPAVEEPAAEEAPADDVAAAEPDSFEVAPPVAPWQDPRVQAGAAGVLVLLLLLLLVMRRRRRAAAEDDDSVPAPMAGATAGAGAVALDAAAPEPEAAEPAASADPAAEAEMYMGHGRYEDAREALQRGLADEPGNKHLRLKMLEIHALDNDRPGFETEAQDLYALVDGANDPVWQRAVEMGQEIAPEHPLFSRDDVAATPDEGDAADVPAASDDAFDLDGVFELDDTPDEEPRQEAARQEEPRGAASASDDDLVDMESMGDDLSDLEFALDDDEPADRAEHKPVRTEGDTGESPAEADDEFAMDFDLDAMEADRTRRETAAMSPDPSGTQTAQSDGDDDNSLEFMLEDDDRSPADSAESGTDEERPTMDEAESMDDLEFELDTSDDADALPEERAADDDVDDEDLFEGADENSTKLDLARAYLDMGDADGARSLLEEVLEEGNDAQKQEAEELLGQSA